MIDVVNILINHINGLIIFLHDQLRSLDMALLIEVWDDQSVFKSHFSDGLSQFREKQLLPAHKLDLILLVVTELDYELIKLKGALGWVFALEVLDKVLSRYLILHNLGDWVAVSSEETLLLVENLGGPGKGVGGESSLCLAHILSHFEVGVNACLLDDLHFLDVKDQ